MVDYWAKKKMRQWSLPLNIGLTSVKLQWLDTNTGDNKDGTLLGQQENEAMKSPSEYRVNISEATMR